MTQVPLIKSSYDYDELILAGEGKMFHADSPRLPLPNMLMCSRIAEVSKDGGKYGRGYIEAELDIHPDLWFFHCHFRGDPVMPGCLGLDAMWQLTGFFLAWCGHRGMGRALGVKDVGFTGQILPENKKVTYKIDIRRVLDRKLVMAIADGRTEVDGQCIYTADNMRVGIFVRGESSLSGS